ncbi:sorting nexin-18-like, partial [Stegodyphus dumicola]|uniref:sorting nexin-18-like n=1 Tax=Stegodyphus dumicola TaxID=202533 RepID=UPI0015B1E1B1
MAIQLGCNILINNYSLLQLLLCKLTRKVKPRNDLEPFGDILHEYKGILAAWPEIVQIQKGAVQKKKEHQKLMEEGKLSQENVAAIARRTDIISYAVMAEITHFQQEQVGEFKNMIQGFLQAQVKFYLKVSIVIINCLCIWNAN